jgi:signal transduction histidine kinase
MSGLQRHDVRRTSIRVALAATILVAAAYTVIAFAVVAIVTQNLTAQIDDRLTRSLSRVPQEPFPGGGGFEPPPGDRPFGPTTLVWTIKADGTVVTGSAEIPALPVEYRAVSSPTTVTIDGTEMRIAGAPAGGPDQADYVVVGQTMDAVTEAQATVIRAELIIGPVLLLVVFLGAIAIGRRVAAPIERARRRQLEFTADASHELRTPLAVIEANTSLALAQDRPAEWYRDAFVRVDGESKRMRRLVEDLLWLARFDATQAPPSGETVDLGILAAGTADRFAAVAETRRLRIAVHTPDGIVVAVPAEWTDRLVGVLVDNACKYSPQGGTVDVTVDIAGGRARLTVDDAGPGIPQDQRDLVFDRFHRATDSGGGAGLGLAIADAIVRATGGRWLVERSPAGGARMSVSWPLAGTASRDTGHSTDEDA